jgi:hypothetical protein
MDVWSPSRYGCFTPSETLLVITEQKTGWIPKLVSMPWKNVRRTERKHDSRTQVPNFWSSWRLNFVCRPQIFAGPQYGTYFTSLMTPPRFFFFFFCTLAQHQKSHKNVRHNVSSHLSATDGQTRLRSPDSHVRNW